MNIAIAGYGIEGKASFDYYRTPGNEVVIADERAQIDAPAGARTILGSDAFSRLGEFDLIIRSPSIPPKKLPYLGKVWSATNEFFAKCPVPIIGVTGTKGKGTTCSLITSILRAAGKTVHLVGNIGEPALTILPDIGPDDVVVYELSSFQLWDLKKSPHIAVVLMIEPDHLEVHADMDEYVAAKARIATSQTSHDVVIFNKDNRYARQIAAMSPARKIEYPFSVDEFIASLRIPGKHNQENASAAIAAAREYGVSDDAIREGLRHFTGLPHRLKFVREVAGVTYYDDSISTTPGSAVAALASFEEPKIIILGGFDKHVSYEQIVRAAKEKEAMIVAIGQTGQEVARLAQQQGARYVRYEAMSMQQIVEHVSELARPGSVVLLSPASASFDMFKNYAERGEQFVTAVEHLSVS